MTVNGFTYRDQKGRYPWWVKSVDEITTETDDSRFKKANLHSIAHGLLFERETIKENDDKSRVYVAKGIKENIPGRSLPDLALHYAAATYQHITVGSLGDPYINIMPGYDEISSKWKLHPPQSFDLPAWKASPREASRVVEKAGIQLGAAMVGFTTLDRRWLSDMQAKISSDVEIITPKVMQTLIPEKMKYVICLIGVVPPNLVDRNRTELGAAGDRAGFEAAWMAYTRMMRFIKGLGYQAFDLQPVAPLIPYAISAGLGELGRMNRMVNPIFGGNVKIGAVLTDLPLALDKPIDFGLQEFCKGCKKCADACPGQAISHEDEPTWEPFNTWQDAGKKVYFENNQACIDAQKGKDWYCSTCMAVCPWSKQDKTLLHEVAHITAAKFPSMANFMVKMDDLFGYGRISDKQSIKKWWDLDIPVRGVDSYQGRRKSALKKFIR